MKTDKVYSNTPFNAKLVRTQLFNQAVETAKKAPEYEKKIFRNALELIHDDLTLKSVELKRAADNPDSGVTKHITAVLYNNDHMKTYCNIINNKAKEGIEAMYSLFNFIESHYGANIFQSLRVRRFSDTTDINESIDNILKANAYRYM